MEADSVVPDNRLVLSHRASGHGHELVEVPPRAQVSGGVEVRARVRVRVRVRAIYLSIYRLTAQHGHCFDPSWKSGAAG